MTRNTHRISDGGRSKISRWLMVGIEPCNGRIKNLLELPKTLCTFNLSWSLDISSQPVRNTSMAPSSSCRHIYSMVASTYKHTNMNTIKKFDQVNRLLLGCNGRWPRLVDHSTGIIRLAFIDCSFKHCFPSLVASLSVLFLIFQ